ncbi:MAG TPA: glycosyltransferase family 2 protein [Gammaproteobacteria bacterium]|nr:glycosyltransferase family 2 protein [Gammaproteobacteria bacterium]
MCVVVPHFDHVEQFAGLLPNLTKQGLPLVIVDDGSPDEVFAQLERLVQQHAPESMLLRHARNQGKGGAVMTGLKAALAARYSHALQIDADGQHDVGAISRFVETAVEFPDRLICGQPVFDESISGLRYYSRFITLYLSWLQTLSSEIKDALCGLRLYPLTSVVPIIERRRLGKRMAFDPEILVRCCWAGIRLRYMPVKVHYPESGRSHFNYLDDNLKIAWMHIRLVAGMLLRLPMLVTRRLPVGHRGVT